MDFLSLDIGVLLLIPLGIPALAKFVEKKDFPQITGQKEERRGKLKAMYISM